MKMRQALEGEMSKDSVSLLYLSLTWVFAFYLLISICFGLFYSYRSYIDLYKYLYLIQFSLQLALFISCIGAIIRKVWAVHAVRVTGVWYLALIWSDIPYLAQRTV